MPVSGVLEYLWFRDNDPWWATLLRIVTLIAIVAGLVIKSMNRVPSGNHALRTRFRKVVFYRKDKMVKRDGEMIQVRRGDPKQIGAGLVIGVPFVHNVQIQSVQESFLPLPLFVRMPAMEAVQVEIFFQVVDLYRALILVKDFQGALVNKCAAVVCLLNASELPYEGWSHALMADKGMRERAEKLGVQLLWLNLSTANLTEPAQLALAFKQHSVGVNPALAVISYSALGASSTGDADTKPALDLVKPDDAVA